MLHIHIISISKAAEIVSGCSHKKVIKQAAMISSKENNQTLNQTFQESFLISASMK